MKISSFKKSACIRIIAISFGLALALSCANLTFADESLEQLLTSAMENHPDIAAAKAKVTLAEAELNATRLQVARQVIALWGNRNSQNDALDQSRNQLNITKDSVERGMLVRSIQDAQVKIGQAEAEIKYLTAKATPAVSQSKDSQATPKPIQIPTGPIVEQIRKKFQAGETIDMDFADTSIWAVLDYWSNYLKIPVFFDKDSLCGETTILNPGQGIRVSMHDMPVAAAFQYFQDQNQGTQIVIRDYGFLLTSIDQAKAQGYCPAVEFAKSIEKEKSTEENQPSIPPSKRSPIAK